MSPRGHALRGRLRVVSREDLGAPYPKCSLLLRGGARLFDLAIAYGVFVVFGPAGAVASILFLLLADGMLQGQSVGKRLFGVKVVFLPTRSAGRYRESVLRNAPLALIVLLSMMPPPLGLGGFLAGLCVVGGVEAFRVIKDPLGLRRGDLWAQTQVVDGKVAAGAGSPFRTATAAASAGRVMFAA